MTEVEQLKEQLKILDAIISSLEEWHAQKKYEHSKTVFKLNRARRLEREERCKET